MQRLFLRTGTRQLTWPAPDPGRSLFREADPPRSLAQQVAKIRWGHEWIPPEAPVEERIVPDGAVHLLFVASSAGSGPSYGLVVGATSEAVVIRLAGRIEHVEIELLAGAVPALLGLPAGALSGQAVALEHLWGDRAAVMRDRLLASATASGRLDIIQETLSAALRDRPAQVSPLLGEARRRIARAGGNLRVGALAADLGITDRRLEQLFHQHVGLSPKTVCRLARFHATLELLARPAAPAWAEMALEAGFVDQSHLVNEFRALTGLAPRDFQRRAGFGFLQDGAEGRPLPSRSSRRRTT